MNHKDGTDWETDMKRGEGTGWEADMKRGESMDWETDMNHRQGMDQESDMKREANADREEGMVWETDINQETDADRNAGENQVKISENSEVGRPSDEEAADCACHRKATPRGAKELRQLRNRLSRMIGQMNGIGRMLDENRYCGEILTQIAAVESALQSFGYLILREHMETCVVEEIQKGNVQVVDEAVELVKKLK